MSSFLVLVLPLSIGCGGVTTTTNPRPTPGPGITAPVGVLTPSRFIYGIMAFESQEGTYASQINSQTGMVSPVAGSPYATKTENIVTQAQVDPKGRFLYLLNIGASSFGNVIGRPGIDEYRIDPLTGALSLVLNGNTIFPSQRAGLLAIDGLGRFLYQPDGGGFDVYSIDQGTGILSPMAGNTVPSVGLFTVASSDARLLFNAGNGVVLGSPGNGMVESVSIDQATGQLSSVGTPLPTGGSAGPLAVSHDGKSLYVANVTEGNVAVFNVGASGALTPATGSPFTIDGGARAVSLTADGKFLYVASNQNATVITVKGYAVNPVTGIFTAIPGAIVNNASTVTLDGSGKFAYITEGSLLSTYSINPATGALTRVSQTAQPVSDTPADMAVAQ